MIAQPVWPPESRMRDADVERNAVWTWCQRDMTLGSYGVIGYVIESNRCLCLVTGNDLNLCDCGGDFFANLSRHNMQIREPRAVPSFEVNGPPDAARNQTRPAVLTVLVRCLARVRTRLLPLIVPRGKLVLHL